MEREDIEFQETLRAVKGNDLDNYVEKQVMNQPIRANHLNTIMD